MRYNVGQVLYAVINETRQVVPVRIVEETIRKRVDGETCSYMVELPDSSSTIITLDKLNAEVFLTCDDVRASMIASATSTIDKIVEKAQALKRHKFNIDDKKEEGKVPELVNDKDNANVDLGNGVRAKIDLSQIDGLGARE